jgi:hypothetical protein
MSKLPPDVDVKVAVLDPKVTELAEKLKKIVSIDKKTGEFDADKHKAAFVENLPSNCPSVEQIKNLQNYTTTFVAATGLVTGECGQSVMEKAKTVDRVHSLWPTVGRDKVEHVYERERKAGGEGKSTFGVLTSTMDVYGAGATRGELKKVCAMLSANALAAFGGDAS